jgi:hypothetical protein
MKHILLLLALPLLAHAAGTDWSNQVFDKRGPRSALENPALLAEQTSTPFGFEIAGVGVTASNNSFSVKFWNSRIAGDEFWDASDTKAILKRIPASGFALQADVDVPVLGVRYRNFAFNVVALAAAHANVPKSVAEIALAGSRLDTEYSLEDLIGESLAFSDASLAYGQVIPQDYLPEVSAGVAVHYYRGLVYTDTRNSTAGFVVTDQVISGSGQFQNIVAKDGSGLGADLGLAATLSPDGKWKAGLCVQRIGACMSWHVNETQTAHFSTNMDGVNIDSLDKDGYADRALVHSDTTLKGGTTRLILPMTVRMTGEYQAFEHLRVAGIIDALTSDSPLGEAGMEAGVASEYEPLRWVVVHGGILFGGDHGSLFSIGTGLRFRNYEMDLNFSSAGGLGTYAHGAGVAFSQRFFL